MYGVLNTVSEYAYQKTFLHTLLMFVFKIVKSLQCILKGILLCLIWTFQTIFSKLHHEKFMQTA